MSPGDACFPDGSYSALNSRIPDASDHACSPSAEVWYGQHNNRVRISPQQALPIEQHSAYEVPWSQMSLHQRLFDYQEFWPLWNPHPYQLVSQESWPAWGMHQQNESRDFWRPRQNQLQRQTIKQWQSSTHHWDQLQSE